MYRIIWKGRFIYWCNRGDEGIFVWKIIPLPSCHTLYVAKVVEYGVGLRDEKGLKGVGMIVTCKEKYCQLTISMNSKSI